MAESSTSPASPSPTVGLPLEVILEACEAVKAKGWQLKRAVCIARDSLRAGGNRCCALGAVVLHRDSDANSEIYTSRLAAILGIDEVWAEGFADAFDGGGSYRSEDGAEAYDPGYAAGTACREALAAKEGTP